MFHLWFVWLHVPITVAVDAIEQAILTIPDPDAAFNDNKGDPGG